MKTLFATLFILVALISCSNPAADNSQLLQEPYKNISDSISQLPNNAALYYRRGSLLYQHEEKALAEKDLRKAWQLQPTEQHALSVVTILADKNPDSAIAFIEQALNTLPKSIALQISLARGYQQKNEDEKALAVCDRILAQHPNSLDALILKSELLKKQNKNEEALTALEKAHSYAPFDAELSYNLAFEYAEAKNARALHLADSLIRMDTSERHAEPYYLKGVYYENIGNTAQALNLYNQAIQHDYNYLDAYVDKGKLLYHQKKYAEALQTFQLTTRITPTFAYGYFWTAKCQEALKQNAEAKLNYQRAYGLDNELTEAKTAADNL